VQSRIRVPLGVFALMVAGCPSPQPSPDAATSVDAFVAGDAPSGADDAGSSPIRAIGSLAQLHANLSVTLLPDWRVCTVGPSDPRCDDTGLVGDYLVEVPPASELALRAFDPMDATEVPWIRPIRSGSTDVQAATMLMPDRDFTATLTGGFREDRAYAVVYVERPIEGMPLTLLGRGVPGYTVTSSLGSVRYVAADLASLDDAATATTTSGLVVVTDIAAGSWSEGAALTDMLSVTVTAPAGDTLCATPAAGLWIRAQDAGSFTAEAPVFAGHVTYAAYVHCPPL